MEKCISHQQSELFSLLRGISLVYVGRNFPPVELNVQQRSLSVICVNTAFIKFMLPIHNLLSLDKKCMESVAYLPNKELAKQ